MGRRKKPFQLENIEIIDIANKGKSVAKYNGITIFIKGGIPGDICNITVFKKRKKFWEAKIYQITRYSHKRVDAKCEHFGTCGGCKWQNMRYKDQLFYKQKIVYDNLRRIGGAEINDIQNIIGSKAEYYYRNKLEFSFSNKRWLSTKEIKSQEQITNKNACGFHVTGMFDKVINIEKCFLQQNPSNKIRVSIKKFADKHKLEYFDIRKNDGLLRNLTIRNSSTNDLMVLVQFYKNDKEKINLLMEYIQNSFPEITSLLYVINDKLNNTIYDQKIKCYHGKDYIIEKINGLYFKIGPKSFFQTNSQQTNILYEKTKELAGISSNDLVYDLYTGTGTIAQYLASAAKHIIGIDSVEEGIKAAYDNCKKNKITNCTFFSGDMKKILTNEFITTNGYPDIIITDPPREGMHKKVVEKIIEIQVKKIVYISCNPATQSRDISMMLKNYTITKIQPIDMFPQTHHVENIVILELK